MMQCARTVGASSAVMPQPSPVTPALQATLRDIWLLELSADSMHPLLLER